MPDGEKPTRPPLDGESSDGAVADVVEIGDPLWQIESLIRHNDVPDHIANLPGRWLPNLIRKSIADRTPEELAEEEALLDSAILRGSYNSGPERDPTKDLARTFARDFFFSFRFAQGDAELQSILLENLGKYYQATLPPKQVLKVLTEGKLQTSLEAMQVPKTHIFLESSLSEDAEMANLQSNTFKTFAADFAEVLTRVANGVEIGSDSDEAYIVNSTIVRDIRFQSKPRGYKATDPHASYYREYILGHEPTGSEAYDAIFRQASDLVEAANGQEFVPNELRALILYWGPNHPNEAFYPDQAV